MRIAGLLVTLLSLSACQATPDVPSDDRVPAGARDPAWAVLDRVCTPDAPIGVLSAAQRATLSPFSHGESRVIDDDWADAARTIPGGWGGGYIDRGTPTIFLSDPSQHDAAIAALSTLHLPGLAMDVAGARVRRGRWDFAQLADWFAYLRPYIPATSGLQSADIQEAQNRLEYTVPTTANRLALEAALRPLHPPCYLVAINPAPR